MGGIGRGGRASDADCRIRGPLDGSCSESLTDRGRAARLTTTALRVMYQNRPQDQLSRRARGRITWRDSALHPV